MRERRYYTMQIQPIVNLIACIYIVGPIAVVGYTIFRVLQKRSKEREQLEADGIVESEET